MKAKSSLVLALLLTTSLTQANELGENRGPIVDGPVFNRPIRPIRPTPIVKETTYSFHYISPFKGEFEPQRPTQLMQAKYGNQVVIAAHKGGETSIFDIVSQEEVPSRMAELEQKDDQKCMTTNDPTTSVIGIPNFVSGGKDAFPREANGSWSGYGPGKGGCGTWATMMCNRILGKTPAKVKPSKGEWNRVARGIDQGEDGGSFTSGRAKYYEKAGYCASYESFSGKTASYKKMAKLMKQGCDLKLTFWKKLPNGDGVNGHVEVVTGVNISRNGKGTATTNSWGKPATITGGEAGGFSHSEDHPRGHFKPGGLWPANNSGVRMEYVCKCTALQKLAKLLRLR